MGTHWIGLYALNNNVTYFDSFGVEPIPKEIKIIIDKSIVTKKIFRIQAYDLIMCEYFCIGFIDFMLAGKALTDFTNLFARNYFKKNSDTILKYFMTNIKKRLNAILLKHIIYIQIWMQFNWVQLLRMINNNFN